jgi:hypothetical protein
LPGKLLEADYKIDVNPETEERRRREVERLFGCTAISEIADEIGLKETQAKRLLGQ